MAAKKTKSNGAMNLLSLVALALGIFLVISGVLSTEVDSWRALMLATGLGVMSGGIIGFCPSPK